MTRKRNSMWLRRLVRRKLRRQAMADAVCREKTKALERARGWRPWGEC